MSHKFKNRISLFLAASIIFMLAPFASADNGEAPKPVYFDLPVKISTAKVGISFGSSARSEVTLQNNDAEGFELGIFDFSRVFHSLGKTSGRSLTMHPDKGFTYTKDEAEKNVGEWHIITEKVFDNFGSARESADKYYGGFVAYLNGEYRVLAGAFDTSGDADASIAERGLDAEIFSGGDNCIICMDEDNEKLVFLTDGKLALRAVSESFGEIWYAGNLYYGDIELILSSGKLTVISYVPLEDYVKCVLPYEMITSWPKEALKAQGACARTYVTHYMNAFFDMGFDVRNDTYSQVYKGRTGTAEASNDASEASAGMYVRYRGAPCKIYYMSSDGGATDSSANVFSQRRAYLSGVTDHNEDELDFYNKTWCAVLREETVLRRLGYSGYELSDIADIKAEKSYMGIVVKLTLSDSSGNTVTLNGDDCFLVLSLNSLNYDVYSEDEGLWTFNGRGWGHNCGMSQWGAYSMAKNSGASCDNIIDFYFSGAYLR